MNCVDDLPMTREQIEMFIAGDVSPEMLVHLHRCKACRATLLKALQGEALLQSLLHPSPRELLEFVENSLDDPRHSQIEEHVNHCSRCRALVIDLQSIDVDVEIPADVFAHQEVPPLRSPERSNYRRTTASLQAHPSQSITVLSAGNRLQMSAFQVYMIEDIQIRIRTVNEERLLEGFLLGNNADWGAATVIVLTDDNQQVTVPLDKRKHFVVRGLSATPIRIVIESDALQTAIEIDLS